MWKRYSRFNFFLLSSCFVLRIESLQNSSAIATATDTVTAIETATATATSTATVSTFPNSGLFNETCEDPMKIWNRCAQDCPLTCDSLFGINTQSYCDSIPTCAPQCTCLPGYLQVTNSTSSPCVTAWDCFMTTDADQKLPGKRDCLKKPSKNATFNNLYVCDESQICCPDLFGKAKCCQLECPWPKYICGDNCCFLWSFWFLECLIIVCVLGSAGGLGCGIYDPYTEEENTSPDEKIFGYTRQWFSNLFTSTSNRQNKEEERLLAVQTLNNLGQPNEPSGVDPTQLTESVSSPKTSPTNDMQLHSQPPSDDSLASMGQTPDIGFNKY